MSYKNLFLKAVAYNVIVFDCNVKEGIISKRLLDLMSTWASGKDPTRIDPPNGHVPHFEIVEWIFPPDGAIELNITDIGFIISDEIGAQAYKDRNGYFPHMKSNIIMGVGYLYHDEETEEEIAILGAF